jgi:hypothetical protein
VEFGREGREVVVWKHESKGRTGKVERARERETFSPWSWRRVASSSWRVAASIFFIAGCAAVPAPTRSAQLALAFSAQLALNLETSSFLSPVEHRLVR